VTLTIGAARGLGSEHHNVLVIVAHPILVPLKLHLVALAGGRLQVDENPVSTIPFRCSFELECLLLAYRVHREVADVASPLEICICSLAVRIF